VLIAGEVLEHLVDPWVALKRLRRFLRPDALAMASSPNVPHHSTIRMLLKGERTLANSGRMDRTHLRWYAQILRRDVPGLRFRGRLHRAALRIRPAGQAGQQAYRRAPRAPLYLTDRCRRQECGILKERVNAGRTAAQS
jgi:hypothetical protein